MSAMPTARGALLRFDGLGVRFGAIDAVRSLSLAVAHGETAAIVGETGSGKSVAMLAALGLLPRSATVMGRVVFDGVDLLGLDRPALNRIRGKAVSIVFQEPQSALDPLYTVGAQIAAVLRFGRGLDRRAAWTRAVDLLDEVGISEPARRATLYPHELSGGQRQRVAIAMAIACEPKLLIADEPTTALDVTVAAKILALLADLKARRGMALILISHDLGLVRRVADSIHVMEKGVLVESGSTDAITRHPTQPYTKKLLAADALVMAPPRKAEHATLIEARNLTVSYALRGGGLIAKHRFTAVDGVTLRVERGETLGLIGESGSGKSTLGRALLKLEPSTGTLLYDGRDLQPLSKAAMRPLRRDLQIVFQDPFSSLSPRRTVGDIVGEGLAVHEPALAPAARNARAITALEEVGLAAAYATRLPHELSGGQRQRVAIARALILAPRLIVLDEPTSALDRSVQAEILGLLRRLQADRGLAYLFITHDLAVVRAMAARTAVMKDGKIVETGPTAALFERPIDAYTRNLIASAFEKPSGHASA
jgi:ABC-type microcin C transport system duplicated ATPase subunit YejF